MNEEKRIDRMGMIVVMSHLLITLAVLGIYAFALFKGVDDETLKTLLTVIAGYWFGAMGNDVIKNRVIKKNVDNKEKENGTDGQN